MYQSKVVVQGYLAHKKTPPPLGPPKGPRHSPTVGSYGEAFSYERGTPVALPHSASDGQINMGWTGTVIVAVGEEVAGGGGEAEGQDVVRRPRNLPRVHFILRY